jgi:hypothetical protein
MAKGMLPPAARQTRPHILQDFPAAIVVHDGVREGVPRAAQLRILRPEIHGIHTSPWVCKVVTRPWGAIHEARGVPRTCGVPLAAQGTAAHPPRPQGRSRRSGRHARLRLLWLRSVLAPPADGSPGGVRLGGGGSARTMAGGAARTTRRPAPRLRPPCHTTRAATAPHRSASACAPSLPGSGAGTSHHQRRASRA